MSENNETTNSTAEQMLEQMQELVNQAQDAAAAANSAANKAARGAQEALDAAVGTSNENTTVIEKVEGAAQTVIEKTGEAAQALVNQAEAGSHAAGTAVAATTGGAIDPFVFQFAIFVMAIFVGYYVVWSVTPALHTPLMAVTNAISSVIVVGALLAVGIQIAGSAATTFGFIALVLAAVNIFGGFLVTQRMLAMYKKKER